MEIGLPMLILLVISQQVRIAYLTHIYGCILFPKRITWFKYMLCAVLATPSSNCQAHAGEIRFACMCWSCLGFCGNSYCFWCLQQCQAADQIKLSYRSLFSNVICSMVHSACGFYLFTSIRASYMLLKVASFVGSRFRILFSGVPPYSEQVMYSG